MAKEFGIKQFTKYVPQSEILRSASKIPVAVQSLGNIICSGSSVIVESTCKLPNAIQYGRIITAADILTSDLTNIEKREFWKGLEIGYRVLENNFEQSGPTIKTSELAEAISDKVVPVNIVNKLTFARVRGIISGSLLSGHMMILDLLQIAGDRLDMAGADVLEKINPKLFFQANDKLNGKGLGNLLAVRTDANVTPTFSGPLFAQIDFAKGLTRKSDSSK